MKIIKAITWIIAIAVLVLAVLFFALKVGDTDQEAMEAKYGEAPLLRTDSGIHYRDKGNRNGTTLLLLHGSNSSLHTWERLIDELASHFRLVSFDQHGHGLTGQHPNNDYSAAARVAAGVEVLNHLGIENAVWVGNSMGGSIAWRAALLAPDQVSGLVLINASGAQTDEKIEPYIGAKIARTWIGKAILPQITPRFMISASLKQSIADENQITDELIDRYWELVRYPGNRVAMVDGINTGRETELWNQANRIRDNTLIIWGEQDGVIPVSHGRAFDETIPKSSLVVFPDAAHLPMEEIPNKVAGAIKAWNRDDTRRRVWRR
ncbi:MAG: alpha/beta hydrolase [Pseudomonadota bacterium]